MNGPQLIAVSTVAEEDATGRHYAFGTLLHDGRTVYIPSLVCEKEGIDYDAIGDRLWAYCDKVPGRGEGTRLTAFVRWDADDEKAPHIYAMAPMEGAGPEEIRAILDRLRLIRLDASHTVAKTEGLIRSLQALHDRLNAQTDQ